MYIYCDVHVYDKLFFFCIYTHTTSYDMNIIHRITGIKYKKCVILKIQKFMRKLFLFMFRNLHRYVSYTLCVLDDSESQSIEIDNNQMNSGNIPTHSFLP